MMKRFLLTIALFALISPLSAQDILDVLIKKTSVMVEKIA